jgi:ribosomal protein S12 methylthiotransferase
VFTYSEEEDTYAASTFKDSLSQSVKQKRADSIMKLQQGISEEKNAEKINSTLKVIIDRKEGDYWIGRSEGDSPEVDNEVLVSTDKKLNIGEFYQVKVTSADLFDLFARY